MSAQPYTVAAAVAAELVAQFAGEMTVTSKALPGATLAELASPLATVVPRTVEPTQVSRALVTKDVVIEIGIQQHLDDTDTDTQVAALAALAEAVLDHLWRLPLPTLPAAQFLAAELNPICDTDLLRSMRVYCGIVRVTYRV